MAAPEAPPAPRPSQVARTPLQRSLLDDVPHGMQSRREVMRGGTDRANGAAGRTPDSMSEPAPDPANPLSEAVRGAGASGPGVELLESRRASMAVEPRESIVGFCNERTVHRTQLKEKLNSAKNLVCHRECEDVKSGLRSARQDEWGKWRMFNAAVPV
eukprot:3471933-Pyramimonas_sp.AAC.1